MQISWQVLEMHPRQVFRISRGAKASVRNVVVRIESDGVAGIGEASTNAYYHETAGQVAAKCDAARGWLQSLAINDAGDIEGAWEESWKFCAPSRAAQCAIDLALWDWLAKLRGISAAELMWNAPARPVTTFCTIGLSTSEELEEKLKDVDGFPRIKLKSDARADDALVRAVRARSSPLIAMDANCAWSAPDIPAHLERFAALGVEFIEQPFVPGAEAHLPGKRPLPVFADESCVLESDVDRMAEFYDGFNIKLVKCGGLTPARRMVLRGRELGRRLMVGCMLESSVLIAAGAAIAQQTDYADLDGAWLLADDPFPGWLFDRGVLFPPDRAGLGVAESL